jgi:SAM-dependent methyltransferase
MARQGAESSGATEGIQIATLRRLWNSARSLSRIRASAERGSDTGAHGDTPVHGSTPAHGGTPATSEHERLWGAYEFQILDVRSDQAFGMRHVPGSSSIPSSQIASRVFELPPKWRHLVVVSDQPEEARALAGQLRERGWLGAVALVESLDGWPGPWENGPSRRMLWEPTAMVRRWAPLIPRGKVLDLGCGSGRDAIYLAMLGHEVTAIDVLPDALEMAERLAARMGVSIRTLEMDLRKETPPLDEQFDAILMVRFLRRDLFPWIAERLRPGGFFLLETFTREQTSRGTPRRPERTLQPQEALRAFSALRVLEYLEMPDAAGDFVARLVAQKEARET